MRLVHFLGSSYGSIQAAINAAEGEEIVLVGGGIHAESVTMNNADVDLIGFGSSGISGSLTFSVSGASSANRITVENFCRHGRHGDHRGRAYRPAWCNAG